MSAEDDIMQGYQDCADSIDREFVAAAHRIARPAADLAPLASRPDAYDEVRRVVDAAHWARQGLPVPRPSRLAELARRLREEGNS